MANQEMLRGNWNSIAGAIKQKYGQITGDDLSRVQGNFEQLVGLIQRKAGQTREQVESFLDQCCSSASGGISDAVEAASQAASKATRYVSEGLDQTVETANRGYEYARETVERRPVESVAVVAGVSMLAGVLIGISLGRR